MSSKPNAECPTLNSFSASTATQRALSKLGIVKCREGNTTDRCSVSQVTRVCAR